VPDDSIKAVNISNNPAPATCRGFLLHGAKMNLQQVSDQLIDTSMQLLPDRMDSAKARVMLLAIGLQESRFTYTHQIGGPAHGYW